MKKHVMENKENPFEKKCCYDCRNMVSYVTWWCTSKEAKKLRGTSIPGIRGCPFWKPDWSYIDKEYKTEEYGYVPIVNKLKKKFFKFKMFK